MTRLIPRVPVLTALLIALSLATLRTPPAGGAETPEPGTVVTLSDVQQILGGKWTSRTPEPGVLFYEEEGGAYRQVNLYLWPAAGRTVESLKAELTQQGEPVDDVPGVGDAALYRPQRNEATVEVTDGSGGVHSLSIAVHNAKAADTQRFAVALAGRGAARLKAL